MDSLSVSSSMLIPASVNAPLTPAMLSVLWGIAHELDVRRTPENVRDALWLSIPSNKLRNPDGRSDNVWLKECLERLTGIQLKGTYRGDNWGAVVLAEWHLREGGALVELLIPPAAIHAIRAPKTFAKIELTAAYKLGGHARRLYAALADKKHMKQTWWEYSLDELRVLFNLEGRYKTWGDLQRHVLAPAVDGINDFGTVTIKATPQKAGRSVVGIRFDWDWKSLDEARETAEENQRHGSARRRQEEERHVRPLDPRPAYDAEEHRIWKSKNPDGKLQDYYDDKAAGLLSNHFKIEQGERPLDGKGGR